MKIIFLDVDWVLIRYWDTPKIRKTRAEKRQGWIILELDEDLADNLKKLIKETWAKIVVSSSWRRGTTLMDVLHKEFLKNNISWGDLVISKTPSGLGHGRGNEILTWLNTYHKTCKDWYHITDWVAIDDDLSDMKVIKRLWKFVNTEIHLGLTPEKTQEAIGILNN